MRKSLWDYFRSTYDETSANSIIEKYDLHFQDKQKSTIFLKLNTKIRTDAHYLRNTRYTDDPWKEAIELTLNNELTEIKIKRVSQWRFILISTLQTLYLTLFLLKNENKLDLKALKLILFKLNEYNVQIAQIQKIKNLKQIILTNSYNNLGYIDGAKAKGASVVEIQHGVIVPSHKGYDYNNWCYHQFFPDAFYLYSKFWASQLPKGIDYHIFNSMPLLKQSISFNVRLHRNSDQPKVIIFAQNTKMRLIKDIISELRESKCPNIVIKRHPKMPSGLRVEGIETKDHITIYGNDKIIAFNSGVLIELHEFGAFCNIWDDIGYDFKFLDNIKSARTYTELQPANYDWNRSAIGKFYFAPEFERKS